MGAAGWTMTLYSPLQAGVAIRCQQKWWVGGEGQWQRDMTFLTLPFLPLICSKHRCDGWSYSGNSEEILRTQGTCQGQQTRETKVAWDALGTVETLVLTTYDGLRVCETTCATVLLKSTWFQVFSLATTCKPKESHRTFGTLHRTKEGLDAPGLICIPMRKIDHVLLTVA